LHADHGRWLRALYSQSKARGRDNPDHLEKLWEAPTMIGERPRPRGNGNVQSLNVAAAAILIYAFDLQRLALVEVSCK
jgi:hypothetical protein